MVCGMNQIGCGLNGYSEQNERALLAEKTGLSPFVSICLPICLCPHLFAICFVIIFLCAVVIVVGKWFFFTAMTTDFFSSAGINMYSLKLFRHPNYLHHFHYPH